MRRAEHRPFGALGRPELEEGVTTQVLLSKAATSSDAVLESDAGSEGSCGFDSYRFLHCGIPPFALDQIDTATELFGHHLAGPLLIPCPAEPMPGSLPTALAAGAQAAQVALAAWVRPGRRGPMETGGLRESAPGVLLFAQLEALALSRGVGPRECARLVRASGADALVLHLDPLQSALDRSGEMGFAGILPRIEEICASLPVPVVVREGGWGLAPDVLLSLLKAGVAAVDVAGWEKAPGPAPGWGSQRPNRLAEAFEGWGVPAAEALRLARRAAPRALIFAGAGVARALDVAKAVALGSDLVGVGSEFWSAAGSGAEAVAELARDYLEVLRVTMFCVGSHTLDDLRRTPHLLRLGGEPLRTHVEDLVVETDARCQFVDITDRLAEVILRAGVVRGTANVYSNHTTVAIRVNENEPLLLTDFERLLERLIPPGSYEHDDMTRRAGVPPDEPVNGHSHCRQLLLSSSETVPVVESALQLGRWQRVFLVELDGPRQRRITVQVMGS